MSQVAKARHDIEVDVEYPLSPMMRALLASVATIDE